MTSKMSKSHHQQRSLRGVLQHSFGSSARPAVAYRQRRRQDENPSHFSAPEVWHEPQARSETEYIVQPAGKGFIHPVTVEEIRERLAQLPGDLARGVEVVQLSSMTRKRRLFPLYGMQWGPNVYLYPIEASLTETYVRPPKPEQLIEARMFGGVWSQQGSEWKLTWSPDTIRDFYLNNVLIHEVGHVNDTRNTNTLKREQYAIWFATEYGYRASRGRARFGKAK
ncbi:rhodanese-like domain-containing protein [Schlesneria paludicola]|uniref:hypothetical protein n=1 Tax=Schlesneria paludicola TaxID=360056 RepID=UPI00029A98EB|nr:hypothetical protein [Schlesneria paludicola]